MKSYKLILFVLLIGACLAATARNGGQENQWTVYAGPGYLARQDLVFSPHVHQDFSVLNAGTEYLRKGRVYQKVMLGIAMFDPMVTQPYTFYTYGEAGTALPHQFYFVELDYIMGRTLATDGRTRLTLGGLFSTDIQAMNYVYGRVGNFGYFAALGLGFSILAEHPAGENGELSTSVSFPLLSWQARSPYLVNDDAFIKNQSSHSAFRSFFAFLADGKLLSIKDLQIVNMEAGYTWHPNRKLGLGLRYGMGIIHSTDPRDLLSFQHNVDLTIHIYF